MGLAALLIATTCYAIAAIDLALRGNALMALVWACYATANAALTKASFGPQIEEIAKRWL